MDINYFSVFLEFINSHFSIDFETIDIQEVDICSSKGKVLIILTVFKILKIHYKHFWGEVLNKYILVYSGIRFSRNLHKQKPYLQSKSIDN